MERSIEYEQLTWVAIPSQLQDGLQTAPLSKRQLKNWALVLQSRQILNRSERVQHGWQLLVPVGSYPLALEELIKFEKENRNWPPPLPEATPQTENTVSTIWVLICLGLFHILTQNQTSLFGQTSIDWYTLGNAHAGKILDGQWWRLVTALTLHSGGVHLAGNIVVGGIFANRLCRDLKSGWGWSLILLSGIAGNLANAFVQPDYHRSIGASTAVFGAVGLLAAINMLRYRSNLRHRWPLPIAAALGLLALLGAGGENTDIGAHLFGFLFGMIFGVLHGVYFKRLSQNKTRFNQLLIIFSLVTVLLSWLAALAKQLI